MSPDEEEAGVERRDIHGWIGLSSFGQQYVFNGPQLFASPFEWVLSIYWFFGDR
jgi:hypothetical protein